MIEICKEKQIKNSYKVTYKDSNDRNFQTNQITRKSNLTCSVSLIKLWRWYVL